MNHFLYFSLIEAESTSGSDGPRLDGELLKCSNRPRSWTKPSRIQIQRNDGQPAVLVGPYVIYSTKDADLAAKAVDVLNQEFAEWRPEGPYQKKNHLGINFGTCSTLDLPVSEAAVVLAQLREFERFKDSDRARHCYDANHPPEKMTVANKAAGLIAALQEVLADEAEAFNEGGTKSEVTAISSRGEPRKKRSKKQWLGEALILIRDHPDWSDAAIATELGISGSNLTRCADYQRAAEMARGKRDSRPRGYIQKDPDTQGRRVDGYSNQDDPAEMDWDSE